ncbi:MAG: sulfatase-like hydrolase/transferase [Candidatus Aminicenantes bacterium]
MKNKKDPGYTDKKTIIMHPFLFAIYPILFLYAHNIKEAYISQIIFPLLFSIVFASLLWGGLFLAIKDKVKSAVISTIFIFLFFLYGHTFDQLKILGYVFDLDIPRHFYLIPLFVILWAVLFYVVKKTKKDLITFTTFLNIIALVLVLYNGFNIAFFEIKKAQTPDTFEVNLREMRVNKVETIDKSQLADIYYIILDEYAASSTIKKLYHYDNSSFIRDLGELGFYIAEESRTRYKMTEQSLASSLNMCYLKKGDNFYPMVRDNQVVEILKKAGYKIIAFLDKDEALFTRSDLVFNFSRKRKSTLINEFYMTFLKTTMLRVLYEWYIDEKYYNYYYRKKTLYIFEELEKIPPLQGPKFVFVHIECPHWPFVFDRDGGPVDPRHFTDLKNKKYYLDQYIFVNKKVKHLVEVLIHQSASPPVIVIQSDHGPRGFGPGGGYYQMEVGDEWTRIFNAYYLPGKDHQGLYPWISPFNTFRLIFNLYFDADYPMLKD